MNEKNIYSCEKYAYQVEVNKRIIIDMKKYCKQANGRETGGILIGKYSEDLKKAIITTLPEAPPDSKHFRNRFIRGNKQVLKILTKYWLKKSTYYLGEWHFHPLASPEPSNQDIKQMNIISKNTKINCPEPILIIIASNKENEYELGVNLFIKGKHINLKT